ncbi:MAG: ABC transporter substrate-binding protein, partial [Armatimonadota bacterium]
RSRGSRLWTCPSRSRPLLHRLLEKNNMTIDDVDFVEMAPPDMPAALARGDIKAYIVAEPFGSESIIAGHGKKLVDAREIWPDYICCVLVANPDFAKKHREALNSLAEAIVEAGIYIDNHQDEVIKIAGEYFKINEKTWHQSFEWGVEYSELSIKKDELKDLETEMEKRGLLKESINVEEVLKAEEESF